MPEREPLSRLTSLTTRSAVSSENEAIAEAGRDSTQCGIQAVTGDRALPFYGGEMTSRKSAGVEKIETRSPNKPAYRRNVDAAKYAVMKKALLAFFPRTAPGRTQNEMMVTAKSIDKRIFPGTTGSWWAKCVQLDLEARGLLIRERTRPLRWHRTR